MNGIIHGKRPEPACHGASACKCWLKLVVSHHIWCSCPSWVPKVFSWLEAYGAHHLFSWCLLLSYTSVFSISPTHPVLSFPKWSHSFDDVNPYLSMTILQGSWALNLTFGSRWVLCTWECLNRASSRSFQALSFLHLKLVSTPAPRWSHLVVKLGQENVRQIWPPVPITMAGILGAKVL